MIIEIIAKIVADVKVSPDDVVNSDTVGEYNTQLMCDVGNSSLDYLSQHLKNFEDIQILSAQPSEYSEEYRQLLNNWQPEYTERMQKYESEGI